MDYTLVTQSIYFVFNLSETWPRDHWNSSRLQQDRHRLKGIQETAEPLIRPAHLSHFSSEMSPLSFTFI